MKIEGKAIQNYIDYVNSFPWRALYREKLLTQCSFGVEWVNHILLQKTIEEQTEPHVEVTMWYDSKCHLLLTMITYTTIYTVKVKKQA